jgi:CRAL/TRIO domain
MTSFTLSNMDYTPIKFMIKIFEANYPESLGAVLVHHSPWVFQGIWTIVKNWLDPVVAAKVHFTKTLDDLDAFIPRARIPRDLSGTEDWTYRFVEPTADETHAEAIRRRAADPAATQRRRDLEDQRTAHVAAFQDATFAWLVVAQGGRGHDEQHITNASVTANDEPDTKSTTRLADLAAQRDRLATALTADYWALDPYVRARSLYDRLGVIGPGGVVDFYPEEKKGARRDGEDEGRVDPQMMPHSPMVPGANGVLGKGEGKDADADANGVPASKKPAADDVD